MTEGTQTVAEILKDARKERGRSIDNIATELNIRPCFLQALEDGRYEDLPPPAFSAGFVRSYGMLLGLDGGALARDFKYEAGGENARPELNFPEPVAESRVPGRAVLLMGGTALLAIYFGWIANFGGAVSPDMVISPVPDRLSGLSSESAQPPSGAEDKADDGAISEHPNVSAVQDTDGVSTSVAHKVSTDRQASLIERGASPFLETGDRQVVNGTDGTDKGDRQSVGNERETLAVTTAVDRSDAGHEDAGIRPAISPRVLIKAQTDTWFYVVDARDREVWNGVLRAGENWTPRENDDGLRLMTSNAGALRVIVDGVDIGALGDGGDVVRDVLLTPDGLKKRERLAMR